MDNEVDIQNLYGRVMFAEYLLRTFYHQLIRDATDKIQYTSGFKDKFLAKAKTIEMTANTPENAEAIRNAIIEAVEDWFDSVLLDLGSQNIPSNRTPPGTEGGGGWTMH